MNRQKVAEELVSLAKELMASYGSLARLFPDNGKMILSGEFEPPRVDIRSKELSRDGEIEMEVSIVEMLASIKKVGWRYRIVKEEWTYKGGKALAVLTLKGKSFDKDEMATSLSKVGFTVTI